MVGRAPASSNSGRHIDPSQGYGYVVHSAECVVRGCDVVAKFRSGRGWFCRDRRDHWILILMDHEVYLFGLVWSGGSWLR